MPNQSNSARASSRQFATRPPRTEQTPSTEARNPCERAPSSLRTELPPSREARNPCGRAPSSSLAEPVGTAQVDTGHCGMETPLRKFESANPLLTDREACEYLRLCPRQLYALRKRGLIPFVRIGGRTVRYRLRDLDAAIEAMTVV
jgi:excisionase family DNA binding protein